MKVVCYGDSNTFGYDPRGYFGGQYDRPWPEILSKKTSWNVINQGLNGREIPKTPISFPEDTDLLIIMLGTNDLLQGASLEDACKKMEQFLESLTLNRDKILLIAPPPMKFGKWVHNQELIDNSIAIANQFHTLAIRLGIRFTDTGVWNVPLAYDGVHLTEEGHRAFANGLFNYFSNCWNLV